ncbi:hypothetical protein N601_29005 [Rhodococcus erythropolis DN1]|nr:hypothetical protein N601_29005 [Rhodococcus erythropolis DN1]
MVISRTGSTLIASKRAAIWNMLEMMVRDFFAVATPRFAATSRMHR